MPNRIRHIAWWKRSGWRLAVALGLSSGLVLAGVAIRVHDTQVLNERICAKVNRLDSAVLTILNRSYDSLPSNPYYKQNPEALRIALANTGAAIHLVKEARC